LRALDILAGVDLIAAEDTRHTGLLLKALRLDKKQFLSHHEHNWRSRVPELIARAKEGASIAVVSDAGSPGISDPGSHLAAACWEANVPIVPVPGKFGSFWP
jgi:16S rRNA (cytidine1402-2'-O)-methyltransferase